MSDANTPPIPRMITVWLDQQDFQVCASSPEEALKLVASRLRVEDEAPVTPASTEHADGYDPNLEGHAGPEMAAQAALAESGAPASGPQHLEWAAERAWESEGPDFRGALLGLGRFTVKHGGFSQDVIAASEAEAIEKAKEMASLVTKNGESSQVYGAALAIFEAAMTEANEELERDRSPILARFKAKEKERERRYEEAVAPFLRARNLAYAEADRVAAKAQELLAAEADWVGRWFATTKGNLSSLNIRAMCCDVDPPQQTAAQQAHASKVGSLIGSIGEVLHAIKARPRAMDRSAQALIVEAAKLRGEASAAYEKATAGLDAEGPSHWETVRQERRAALAPIETRFDAKAIAAMEAFLAATGQASSLPPAVMP